MKKFLKSILWGLLAWKVRGQTGCTGCTFRVECDSSMSCAGTTLTSFALPQVSENAAIGFTGYDSKSQVGLYYRESGNVNNSYVQQSSRTPDTNLTYTGIIRGDNSGTSSSETMSYIGKTSNSGAAVYLAAVSTSGAKTYVTIASKNTNVPGGTNKFTDFIDSSTDIATGHVVFQAESSGGTGIYFWNSSSKVITTIANFNTTMPNNTLKYTYLTGPKIAGTTVLFMGSNYNASSPPAKAALVLYNINNGGFTKVVDYRDTIPGVATQYYTAYSTPGMDMKAGYVSFVAQGTQGYWGLLKYTISSRLVQNIADDTTNIPGLPNRKFTGFQGPPSPNTNGQVGFRIVHEPDAITGVWLATPSGSTHTIIRIVGVTSNLNGATVERIGFGGDSFLDRTMTFPATVRQSSTSRAGVWRVTLPASFENEEINENIFNTTTNNELKENDYTFKSYPKYNEKEGHLKDYFDELFSATM